ncbi:MAG: hypothetical protein H6817_05205 [Phycisphaerales bacterium]|nr:hypothetical protein [Phycisphaerales bacterium]
MSVFSRSPGLVLEDQLGVQLAEFVNLVIRISMRLSIATFSGFNASA